VVNGLVWPKNQLNRDVVSVPREVFLRGRRIVEMIIDHAHKAIGHFGQLKMSLYVRRYYWWPNMAKDIAVFCDLCDTCQVLKTSNKKPRGLLHTLPIPMRPWESVGIDFMGPLPMSQDCDYLMVVIDRVTSSLHLIPMNTMVTATQVAWLYLREVVRLHGVPTSIISDRDSKFTSVFWHELQWLLGTKLLMSTAFHLQLDGATERANRSIGQILRMLVESNQHDWAAKCPMAESALNSSSSATTGFAPFKLSGRYMLTLGQELSLATPFKGVTQFAEQSKWNLMATYDTIIANHMVQTDQANKLCCEGAEYQVGDLLYLSTENLSLPKGQAKKLLPKYIGLYKVLEAHHQASTVKLELPAALEAQCIKSTFHASLVKPHVPNDDERFPH
jgi:hypothetical protein